MPKLRDIDAAREFVREHTRLEDVVESYGYELHDLSRDHVACKCPFHDEEDPSFAISTKKQLYVCYGCHEGGDVFSFVQKIEGVGHIEAIRKLADFSNLDLSHYESAVTKEEREREKYYKANQVVVDKCVKKAKKSKKFLKFVNKRVLDEDIIRSYEVGFSDGPVGTSPKQLGFTRKDQWTDCIVVPIRDSSGRFCGFRNRPLAGKVKTLGPRKDHPLQIPPVYGFYEARKAIRETGTVILVEGEVDVWQMVANGYLNTCGSFGTSFGEEGIEWLRERGVKEVILLPDADEGGRKFANRISRLHPVGIRCKIAFLENGDPDEALLAGGTNVIEKALAEAKYGIEFLVRSAISAPSESITDKTDILADLRDVMAQCNKIEEELAVGLLSESLHLDKASIIDFFRDTEPGESKLYDVRSERAVLSKMMYDAKFIGEALTSIQASDFHLSRHAEVFNTISNLYRDNKSVDQNTVSIMLEMANSSAINILDNIAQLGDVMGADVMLHSIREKSMRRQLESLGRGLLSDSKNPTLSPELVAQVIMSHMSQVVVGKDRSVSIDTLIDSVITTMHERAKNPDSIIGYDLGTDWQSLNRTIHGLQPGRFMVLAAPSGVGKTAVAIGWACRFGVFIDDPVPVLFITLETDENTLTTRMISHISNVQIEQMVTGYVSESDVKEVHNAAAELGAADIKITTQGRTLEEAQAYIMHDKMVRGTKVVILDYIQLMDVASKERGEGHHNIMGRISRGLFHLALDTDISMIALAQINREGAKKFTKADHTDIGDAFKIAQDADIFVTHMEKSQEEINESGIELGNRFSMINKNRRDGKVNVGWHSEADLAVQRVREIPT